MTATQFSIASAALSKVWQRCRAQFAERLHDKEESFGQLEDLENAEQILNNALEHARSVLEVCSALCPVSTSKPPQGAMQPLSKAPIAKRQSTSCHDASPAQRQRTSGLNHATDSEIDLDTSACPMSAEEVLLRKSLLNFLHVWRRPDAPSLVAACTSGHRGSAVGSAWAAAKNSCAELQIQKSLRLWIQTRMETEIETWSPRDSDPVLGEPTVYFHRVGLLESCLANTQTTVEIDSYTLQQVIQFVQRNGGECEWRVVKAQFKSQKLQRSQSETHFDLYEAELDPNRPVRNGQVGLAMIRLIDWPHRGS